MITAHVPAEATQHRVRDRVIEILSERIGSGEYSPGELLPTERTIAADLGVYRRAVREAVEHLAQVGLITHRPNCRPMVASNAPTRVHDALRNNRAPFHDAERFDQRTTSKISASNLVALLMWHGGALEMERPSQQRIFWGMNHALMKLGYHAVFLDLGEQIGTDEENAVREADHLRYVRDKEFGGVLFYPYAYSHNIELAREVSLSVPMVLLDRKMPGVEMDFVGCENKGAMFEVTRHLIEQGHRRIAHVTRVETIDPVLDRMHGYLEAMRSSSYPEIQEMVINLAPYNDYRYFALFDAVFSQPAEKRPTAVVCLNDYTADGVATRLEGLGLSIPRDVAVTGFDNIVPVVAGGVGLTTIAQPYEEIGSTAVELLISRIQRQHTAPRSINLPTRLIVRSSST